MGFLAPMLPIVTGGCLKGSRLARMILTDFDKTTVRKDVSLEICG